MFQGYAGLFNIKGQVNEKSGTSRSGQNDIFGIIMIANS